MLKPGSQTNFTTIQPPSTIVAQPPSVNFLSKITKHKLQQADPSSLTATNKKSKRIGREAVNQSVDLGHLSALSKRQGLHTLQREGKIREVFNMTSLKDNKLENELLETMKHASVQEKRRINNMSITSSTGGRYASRYHLSTKGPNVKAIQRQSLDIDAGRDKSALFEITARPKVLFKNFKIEDDGEDDGDHLPEIEPMLKRRIDDSLVFPPRLDPADKSLIIGDMSITKRYLTRNIFQPGKLHQKESIRDSLESLRKMQYIHQKMANRAEEIENMT